MEDLETKFSREYKQMIDLLNAIRAVRVGKIHESLSRMFGREMYVTCGDLMLLSVVDWYN